MKTIQHITLIREVDPEPDLSWLESTDVDRWMSYGDQWVCLYIHAEATYVVNGICETLHSGGLCGVESDSGEDYLEEIGRQEVEALKGQLRAIGFSEKAIMATPVKYEGEPEFTAVPFAEFVEA